MRAVGLEVSPAHHELGRDVLTRENRDSLFIPAVLLLRDPLEGFESM